MVFHFRAAKEDVFMVLNGWASEPTELHFRPFHLSLKCSGWPTSQADTTILIKLVSQLYLT
jgi:hypothetical protein